MAKTPSADKVDRFVDEYLVHLNASKAYKASHPGCTDSTARTEGSRLLANPDIQEKISAAKLRRSKRTRVTQDRVIRELARIAFVDLRRAYAGAGKLKDPEVLPADLAHSIAGIEIEEIFQGRGDEREIIGYTKKVRFHSKVRALELLLAHTKETEGAASGNRPASFVDLVKKAEAARRAREAK